jgi:hypothetical protein
MERQEMTNTMTTHELFEPSLAARAAARIRRRVLDEQLAAGADTDRPQRACRAAELTRRSTRDQVAGEIEQLLRFPDESHWLRIGPHPMATHVNRAGLQQLAELLRSETPLYVRGPLYTDRDGRALARELARVRSALVG